MRVNIFILILIFPIILFSQSQKMHIAILDLSAGSDVSPALSRDTTDLIRTEMINLQLFTILERAQMKEILEEQGFQLSGCTETSCVVKIGQILSANKILVGTVSKFGSVYTINVRIVDIEKGVGEYAESITAKNQEEIPDNVKILVKRLSGRITGIYVGEGETPAATIQKPWERLNISEDEYREMLESGGSVMGFQQFINAGYDNIQDYIFCVKNSISLNQYIELRKERISPDDFIKMKKLQGNWEEYITFKNRGYSFYSYIDALNNGIHSVDEYYKYKKINFKV